VLKLLRGMPPGTVGVEAVGRVTEEDYRQVLEPAVEDALERRDLKLLYLLGDDFDAHSRGAAWEDTKLWATHLKGWQRIAIVSDADWLENAVKAFSWVVPGQFAVFETDDVDEAKGWLVGARVDDDDD
jgi:hypothetical protein